MQIYWKSKNVIRHITDDLEVCRDDSHEEKLNIAIMPFRESNIDNAFLRKSS